VGFSRREGLASPPGSGAKAPRGLKPTLLIFLALLCSSCGYTVAGRGETLPKTLHTIAIPAFANITTRYKLSDRMPEAISREFITRTRYRPVSDPNQADAILHGSVNNYTSFPVVFDPTTNRAAAVEVHVILQVSLVERATGKVLFDRPRLEISERYEISLDPTQYFEESDNALDRASTVVARQVVSAILNAF
jgi:hypothetical protein